jgi:hypothetical protein
MIAFKSKRNLIPMKTNLDKSDLMPNFQGDNIVNRSQISQNRSASKSPQPNLKEKPNILNKENNNHLKHTEGIVILKPRLPRQLCILFKQVFCLHKTR